MKREPLPSIWRRLWHVLLVLLGWAIYFGFWWKVLATRPGIGPLFIVIPIILVAVPTVTLFWIAHNLRLYRARDARRTSPVIPERYERDWVGRPVTADWERVRRARQIVIRWDDSAKRYEPVANGEGTI